MTDDIRGLPPEAKQQLWQKLAQIDVDGIARKEKALAELAARIEEVAAAIPPAETKAEAAEAKAKAGAHPRAPSGSFRRSSKNAIASRTGGWRTCTSLHA